MPSNQACYHGWLTNSAQLVFNCEGQIKGPILPIEAPSVRGLKVYAARSGNTRFFGAWTERNGVFVGWMRIQPHIAGIESDYAVGEVLGRPIFMGIVLDLSGHDAIDKFLTELKNVAWDLGVAEG